MTFTWTTFAAKRYLKELERDIKAMDFVVKRDIDGVTGPSPELQSMPNE